MKRLLAGVSLVGAVGLTAVFALGASDAPTTARARAQTPPTKAPGKAPGTCGGDGQPRCPLQAWMEDNVSPVMEAQDAARLATLLDQIAVMAPEPSWNAGDNGWERISRVHAEKARAGDFRGARAACKQCHQQWRERYRAEHRTRPLPAR